MYDYIVVGAGFAGSVIAERLASQLNKKVLVVDKRNHIGGNAYDFYDENGILIHKYGPHIFHTNSEKVFNYLSNFTEWNYYEHRVLASVDGKLIPMPINRLTVNSIFGLSLSNDEVEDFFSKIKINIDKIENSKDIIVSKIGIELYEKIFKGYTKKQWDLYPEELNPSVCARIPIRFNDDDRYFSDKYQVMPKHGYSKMFESLLSHPNISILLKEDYKKIINDIKFNKLIYTGPIDDFFDLSYGKLPYRSLKFKFENYKKEIYQPVATINYPNSYDFTRVTEFKHLTNQTAESTTIVREYSSSIGDPYYPIPREENDELYSKYKELSLKLKSVHFIGRLATYKYYNMDQVVAQALTLFEKIAKGDF
ncbi:UDP-galactopyranose mutase [Alicyclobacillus sp. TC]|uniref:UDP-galactopyranose mutase n=1 Tax=Alicyclobacillus sp. TC TaxID=2606450 RepID=UPI0019334B8D|nr:UDP-galactopyranose mutase [Alicyclobacillus sp. TC]QRF24373.1 UDP-galactopyranose mutase [Alicyclobacillus sp. TC]